MVNPDEIISSARKILADRTSKGARKPLYTAREVGSKAKGLLALPEFSAKVLAVLSNTIYLSTQEGEVLWICPDGSPRHRRCILVSLPRTPISGEKIFCEFFHLKFNGEPFIDLNTAMEWNASGLETGEKAPLTTVRASFRQLLGVLNLLEVQDGMGGGGSLVYALMEDKNLPSFPSCSLMGQVRETVLDLSEACLDRDLRSVTQRGKEIVGLGPGLSPSGDDFLGGLLFAAHSLHQAYPDDFPWQEEAVSELLDWARTRTHPISYAIFSDLAFGHGPEPLHDLVAGLLEGKNFDPVMEAAFRLSAIGHSSGWDMLAGLMTGMLMVKGSIEHSAWGKQRTTNEHRGIII